MDALGTSGHPWDLIAKWLFSDVGWYTICGTKSCQLFSVPRKHLNMFTVCESAPEHISETLSDPKAWFVFCDDYFPKSMRGLRDSPLLQGKEMWIPLIHAVSGRSEIVAKCLAICYFICYFMKFNTRSACLALLTLNKVGNLWEIFVAFRAFLTATRMSSSCYLRIIPAVMLGTGGVSVMLRMTTIKTPPVPQSWGKLNNYQDLPIYVPPRLKRRSRSHVLPIFSSEITFPLENGLVSSGTLTMEFQPQDGNN